jgi:hypothetical protein
MVQVVRFRSSWSSGEAACTFSNEIVKTGEFGRGAIHRPQHTF